MKMINSLLDVLNASLNSFMFGMGMNLLFNGKFFGGILCIALQTALAVWICLPEKE